MVSQSRRAWGRTGCLLLLAFLATAVYFGLNIVTVCWDYFTFQDRMKQEARFAQHRTDGTIRRRLRAFADSAGLPAGAREVRVRRRNGVIHIEAEYYDHVELPGFVYEVRFNPQATATY